MTFYAFFLYSVVYLFNVFSNSFAKSQSIEAIQARSMSFPTSQAACPKSKVGILTSLPAHSFSVVTGTGGKQPNLNTHGRSPI